MKLRPIGTALLLAVSTPACALNIVLSNDDGLTSNIKALYTALKASGHDVIVSVPCTGQSGRSSAIVMYSTTVIIPDNDSTQITAENGCHNGAAPTGAPAAGPFTKEGYTNGDYHYVHGTPVMATMYALDVLAPARWGRTPDLVLSGPNEGQNVGKVVTLSGTIGNAQFATSRGIPAIALSAGTDTTDNTQLSNPYSAVVAKLTIDLINALQAKSGQTPLLPAGLALNVNFPNAPAADLPWAFSRIGTFDLYTFKFQVNTTSSPVTYGMGYSMNMPASATSEQAEDESLVSMKKISVTAMQFGFEERPAGQQWLRLRLNDIFIK